MSIRPEKEETDIWKPESERKMTFAQEQPKARLLSVLPFQ